MSGRRAHPSSCEEGIIIDAALPMPLQTRVLHGRDISPAATWAWICVQRQQDLVCDVACWKMALYFFGAA